MEMVKLDGAPFGAVQGGRFLQSWRPVTLVALAALAMGAPSIGGEFVGGDDHQLVLNHVLVNHPSLSHAIELFRIVHRDLYQPLPLLSFQFEFLIANSLGLFDASIRGGAWLFHLTNVLLHTMNAVLVFVLVRRLASSKIPRDAVLVATTAALVFAIHPLQAEVVAWINGRMMLLSTLFALAGLIAFDKWFASSKWSWAIWTIVFVLLSAISKIRIGMPFLLVGVAIIRRRQFDWRSFIICAVSTLLTGIFVAINWEATDDAGMFAGAAQQLGGPRVARTFMALAWYQQHFLWPTGLASWYPTPLQVNWSDAAVLYSIVQVVIGAGVMVLTIRIHRWCAFGWMWTACTIASTLPLVPARNALAADRYMYLPIIGFAWVFAFLVYRVTAWINSSVRRQTLAQVSRMLGVALAVVLMGLSWHTLAFYKNPILKTERIATLFPDTPYVWVHHAGPYYHRGDYEKAIEVASREFEHDDGRAHSKALYMIANAQFELGKRETGIASMAEAIRKDPKNARAKLGLGKLLSEVGRLNEAIRWVEESVEDAPQANPHLIKLASLYRISGKRDGARDLYDRAVANNPYEVPAHMGLVEMAIEDGDAHSLQDAKRRLEELLAWMPENADAWTNLGVVESASGNRSAAVKAYGTALERRGTHGTAALNLSTIYWEAGDTTKSADYLAIALADPQVHLKNPFGLHDELMAHGKAEVALEIWQDLARADPNSIVGAVMVEWTRMQMGLPGDAATVSRYASSDSPVPMAVATSAYSALLVGRYADANQEVERLCRLSGGDFSVMSRLMGALERFDARRPGDPWVFCLSARMLIEQSMFKEASLAIDLCGARCEDESCREAVSALRTRMATANN